MKIVGSNPALGAKKMRGYDMRHYWLCDWCGAREYFRQPELPGDDPDSEMNEDRDCPACGESMYFCDSLISVRNKGVDND